MGHFSSVLRTRKNKKIMSRLLTQCTMRAIPPRREPCRQNALAFETSPPDRLPVVLRRSTSWCARGTEAYAGLSWPVAAQAKGSAIRDRAEIKSPPRARYGSGPCVSMLRALAPRSRACACPLFPAGSCRVGRLDGVCASVCPHAALRVLLSLYHVISVYSHLYRA